MNSVCRFQSRPASISADERAPSERDFRVKDGRSERYSRDPRDPRDHYYQDQRYYYPQQAYEAYRYQPNDQYDKYMRYALKYNYPLFEEMRLKNPMAYSEWYQRNFAAQRYTPTVVTGTGTAAGSIAASEADRASVHSGRSSVNEEHLSLSHQIRGSTTGLDQSLAYDYNAFQVIRTIFF